MDLEPLGRYPETHTHHFEVQNTPLTKWLVVVVAALAVAVIILSWHLTNRQNDRAHKDEVQRQAICAILRQIPNEGHPAILQAKAAFDCQP